MYGDMGDLFLLPPFALSDSTGSRRTTRWVFHVNKHLLLVPLTQPRLESQPWHFLKILPVCREQHRVIGKTYRRNFQVAGGNSDFCCSEQLKSICGCLIERCDGEGCKKCEQTAQLPVSRHLTEGNSFFGDCCQPAPHCFFDDHDGNFEEFVARQTHPCNKSCLPLTRGHPQNTHMVCVEQYHGDSSDKAACRSAA